MRVEPVNEVAAEDEVELVVGDGGLAVAVPMVTHEVVQPAPLLLGPHHVHEALRVCSYRLQPKEDKIVDTKDR